MQRPATDIVSPGPWWGKKEQTAFVYVPLMTGPEVFHNSRILASEDNPASSVQADSNGNMSPFLFGLEPQSVSHSRMIDLGLGHNSRDPVLETAAEQESFASSLR